MRSAIGGRLTSRPIRSTPRERLPDGTTFKNLAEFRDSILREPERFVTTVTEKLLTYALGRGLEYYDMPAVRRIVRDSAPGGYRLSSILGGMSGAIHFS